MAGKLQMEEADTMDVSEDWLKPIKQETPEVLNSNGLLLNSCAVENQVSLPQKRSFSNETNLVEHESLPSDSDDMKDKGLTDGMSYYHSKEVNSALASSSTREDSSVSTSVTTHKVEGMTTEELAEFLLQEQVPLAAVEKLQEEELDGKGFLKLTEDDFKEMKMKIGHRKLIQEIMDVQQQNPTSTVENDVKCYTSSLDFESNPNDLSKSKENISVQNVGSDTGKNGNLLNEIKEVKSESEEPLKQSESTCTSPMQGVESQNPEQVLKTENESTNATKSNDSATEVSKGQQSRRTRSLTSHLLCRMCCTSNLARGPQSPRHHLQSDKNNLVTTPSDESMKSNDLPVERNEGGPQRQCRTILNSSKSEDCIIIELHSNPKTNDIKEISKPDENMAEKVKDVANESSTLPVEKNQGRLSRQVLRKSLKLNIPEILRSHKDGHIVLKGLERKTLFTAQRSLLVHIVCSHIIEKLGRVPHGEEKEALAAAIVRDYPYLRTNSKCGYEHFFDKVTGLGLIEYQLKTLTSTISSGKKSIERKNLKESVVNSQKNSAALSLGAERIKRKKSNYWLAKEQKICRALLPGAGIITRRKSKDLAGKQHKTFIASSQAAGRNKRKKSEDLPHKAKEVCIVSTQKAERNSRRKSKDSSSNKQEILSQLVS